MQNDMNPYQSGYGDDYSPMAAAADTWERATFIRKTYAHLAGAILAFVALECVAFAMTTQDQRIGLIRTMMGTPWSWLLVLGAFMGVSFLANSWANSSTSLGTQYMGLGLYVLAQAIIFLPILFFADLRAPDAIGSAAIVTLVIFGGLTAFVFVTKSDFSGWGPYLAMGGFAAIGFILFSAIFPGTFGLGSIFASLMIVLMCGYILYDTSNVMHHYRTTQHVAAALALFASVATLFWYVLRIMIQLSGRD